MGRYAGMRNIFELYLECGQVVPFRVRRNTWRNEHWLEVTEVRLAPRTRDGRQYGEAFGVYHFAGKAPFSGTVACAGCYQWTLS